MFSYPLSSVPYSLDDYDGTMNPYTKGDTTILLKHTEIVAPNYDFDVEVIDGFQLIHGTLDYPKSYGKYAEYLLKTICNKMALEIHVIFDKFCAEGMLFRNSEIFRKSQLYCDSSTTYQITGGSQ